MLCGSLVDWTGAIILVSVQSCFVWELLVTLLVGEMAEHGCYATWRVQCQMSLMKEGLWGIVKGTEVALAAGYVNYLSKRDRALAIVVLSVDSNLLF